MTTASVGGAGSVAGAAPVSHDVGDIAFLVALLEVETLDLEIGGRLTDMQRLNAVRKAYNERLARLQEHVNRCGEDGRVQVPLAEASTGAFVWDAGANGGVGAAVLDAAGGGELGDGSYRICHADGTPVRFAELVAASGSAATDSPELARYLANPGVWGSVATQPVQTRDVEEARRWAERAGGTVMISVTREELMGEMQTLRDRMDNLSADAEIGMLGLNRLLSRRNQVLQLASNVMSSQHQTAMGLISNLKV